MTERRRRVEELFEEMLDVPPDGRSARLDAACAGDEGLRAEVEALLRAHGRSDGVLDLGSPPLSPDPAPDGERIGPYALVRTLGEGGMGTVWLAERADGQFRRHVAVKLIRSGPYSLEKHRRFLAERQILAALDHPNIARLLDGGFTGDGRPYLVMELVDGLPIDEYCDRHRLGVPERLRLFRSVATAVQHAHRNLIVHRDLKPSNLLVTPEGTPKLLDFGVAKILGPGAALGAPPTQTGRLPMTPEYASPEQVRGDPITTASDVYALGVILYELLCGQRPYDLSSASPGEIVGAVCDTVPPRPSRRLLRAVAAAGAGEGPSRAAAGIAAARGTTPERLARRLEGDLDAIVMTALRKDPAGRYASAEALAQDVANHLESLPVRAHRGGTVYRLRTFLRRHRVETAAAVAVAASLIFGAGAAVSQARAANRERDRAREALLVAEAERDRAREVTDVLVDLFAAGDPAQAVLPDTAAARALLRLGTSRAEEIGHRPLLQATLLDALGTAHMNLGGWDEAEELYRRGLALRTAELGEDDPEVARSLVLLGRLARRRGGYAEAERLYRRALEIQTAALGPRDLDVAETLYELGFLAPYQGHPRQSVELFGRVLEIRRDILGDEHPLVARSLMDEAAALRRTGELGAAEAKTREALRIREDLLGPDHPDVANSLLHLADLLRHERTAEAEAEAEASYRRALDVQRRALGDAHPALAHGLNNLATLLAEHGAHEEALSLVTELVELRQNLFGRRSGPVGDALRNLGVVLRHAGRLDESEAAHEEALGIWHETVGGRHPVVAGELRMLAAVRVAQGRLDEAAALLETAAGIMVEAIGEHHPVNGAILTELAGVRRLQARPAAAESLYLAALDVLSAEMGPGHPDVRAVHEGLAELKSPRAAAAAGSR